MGPTFFKCFLFVIYIMSRLSVQRLLVYCIALYCFVLRNTLHLNFTPFISFLAHILRTLKFSKFSSESLERTRRTSTIVLLTFRAQRLRHYGVVRLSRSGGRGFRHVDVAAAAASAEGRATDALHLSTAQHQRRRPAAVRPVRSRATSVRAAVRLPADECQGRPVPRRSAHQTRPRVDSARRRTASRLPRSVSTCRRSPL